MLMVQPFYYIPKVTELTRQVLSAYMLFVFGVAESAASSSSSLKLLPSKSAPKPNLNVDDYLKPVCLKRIASGYSTSSPSSSRLDFSSSSSIFETVALHIANSGLTAEKVNALPFGISLLLRDAIFRSRWSPPSDWSEEAYRLIDRPDLLQLKRKTDPRARATNAFDISKVKNTILAKGESKRGFLHFISFTPFPTPNSPLWARTAKNTD